VKPPGFLIAVSHYQDLAPWDMCELKKQYYYEQYLKSLQKGGGGQFFFSLYAFTQISHLPFHVMRFNMGIYILNLLRLFTTFCLTNYLVISPEYSPVLQSTHAFLVCARHVPHIYKDIKR